MIDTKKLTVSASPHQKSADTTTGIMRDVIIALVPAGIAAVLVFGLRALAVIVVSVVSCVLAEFLSRKAMKKEDTITDLSAVVTGLLLAYNLPSNIPFWIVVLGAVIAIVVIKQMFGGIVRVPRQNVRRCLRRTQQIRLGRRRSHRCNSHGYGRP